MEKTYDSIKEMLEANIKKIEKKGDISKEDLCAIKEAAESIYYIEAIKSMKSGEYSEGHYHMRGSYGVPYYGPAVEHSYAARRSPTTGRYISDPSYGYDGEYSGHSIKDRMVARLEPMYDEAKSDYERQTVSNAIARIKSEM